MDINVRRNSLIIFFLGVFFQILNVVGSSCFYIKMDRTCYFAKKPNDICDTSADICITGVVISACEVLEVEPQCHLKHNASR